MTKGILRVKINQKIVDLGRELKGLNYGATRPAYDGVYYVPKPSMARAIESRRNKLMAQIAILREVVK